VSVLPGAGPDGGVLLTNAVAQSPRVRLIQTGEDAWNYDRPLASFFEEEPGADAEEDGVAIRMRDARIEGGYVLLDLLDARYEARSLDARIASATLSGPEVDGPVFDVAGAEAVLVLPDTGTGRVERAVAVGGARLRMIDGALAFRVDSATFGGSRLANLDGVWDPELGGLGLDLRLTAVDARVADLPWLPGEVPEGATGTFQLVVEPRPGDRTALALTELRLTAPGSEARGSLRAVIGGPQPLVEAVDLRLDPLAVDLIETFAGPLPYGGVVRGTIEGTGGDIRFDLLGELTTAAVPEPFQVELGGRVALTDAGVELRGTEVTFDRTPLAALRAIAPGLPLRGPISGTVELAGAPGTGPMRLDLRLEAGGGIVTLAGTADISGAVPSYDLQGRLVGVELRSVLVPAAPPAEVHADFSLAGRGTALETTDARVRARGTFTGWEAEPGDTLLVDAGIAAGEVDVDALQVVLGPVTLGATGSWDVVDGGGSLEYDVAVDELGPLEPYLPADPTGQRRFAQGSLRLTGTASGTLEEPVVDGDVSATDFRWGEWAAGRLTGDYAVSVPEGLPRADMELSATELRTPSGAFDELDLFIDFGRPTFEVAVEADQAGGRGVLEFEAAGRIDEEGSREIHLRRVEVDLEEQRWRLPEPAEIAWTAGDAVRIRDLDLVQTDGDGRIRVAGTVAPMDDLDLSFDVARLPVGDVLRLVGRDIPLTGELSLGGAIAGPAATPELDVRVSLTDGSFQGVAIQSLEALVRYGRTDLVVEGTGLLGDSARVEIDGTLPARLQLAGAPILSLVDQDPIDLEIRTETFPLATLDPGLAVAEELEGELQAVLRVGGSPDDPRLSGSAELVGGAVTIPLLDRRFEGIQGAVVLTGREARLRRLTVESEGTAVVQGTLAFQDLTNPALDLTAELDAFRVQEVEDESAAGLWGTVRMEGSLQEPVVTGSIRAADGAVSLAPFQQPELSAGLTGTRELELGAPGTDIEPEPGDAGLRVQELTFTAGDDLWFVTEEARARLAGTLEINRSGEAVTIQGTLAGEGGTFELEAGNLLNRRFQIVSAEIRFFGSPEPNPRLDIVASRVVRVQGGGNVDVRVQVGGTLDDPSIGLSTAGGADIPDSEILSFLLFGRSSADLAQVTGAGGVQGAGLQGLAYTGLAEAFFADVAEEVGFFDYFLVDVLPSGATYITAGVEVSSDLFLETDWPVLAPEAESQADLWAIGLEWYAGSLGVVRGAYEPIQRLDRLVAGSRRSLLDLETVRQWVISWRRRWTY
ncbi:MAG: translocation/assembly module TamB domain-containing protein, partial [Gemmatimonadota bacterium]